MKMGNYHKKTLRKIFLIVYHILISDKLYKKFCDIHKKIVINEQKLLFKFLNDNEADLLFNFFQKELYGKSKNFFVSAFRTKEGIQNIIRKRSDFVFGLYHNNEIIGFGRLKIAGFRKLESSFAVAEKFQRKGIGTKILQELIKLSDSIKFQNIAIISKKNVKSLKFIKKFNPIKIYEDSKIFVYSVK